jgi:hypothetical protein
MASQERLGLDLIALLLIIVAANPAISGVTLHEWVGGIAGLLFVLHMVLNWGWVWAAVNRFFQRIRMVSRLNLVVDAALFVSVVAVTLSGVLVIPGFASYLSLTISPAWFTLHLASSNLTIIFLALHTVLHTDWIYRTAHEMIAPRPQVWVRVGQEVRRVPRSQLPSNNRHLRL